MVGVQREVEDGVVCDGFECWWLICLRRRGVEQEQRWCCVVSPVAALIAGLLELTRMTEMVLGLYIVDV